MLISYKSVRSLSMTYLGLPVLIFTLGFLRWYVALPAACVLLLGFLYACRNNSGKHSVQSIAISRTQFCGLIGVILLWTWLGGMNGLFYQTGDWPWRNAIYHDLVEKSWPVFYPEKSSALVYYFGFWLPPAIPARLVGLLSGSADLAWRVAQGALWLWSCLGLLLTALTLMFYVHADAPSKRWSALLIFIFFSGLDILGSAYDGTLHEVLSPAGLHMERITWEGRQFSSITTCLYWVFNQSIISWLATICFLMEKDSRNYLFLGVSCLCCGPFPFVGLVVLMFVRALSGGARHIRCGNAGKHLRIAFSPANIALLLTVFPIFCAFFLNNLSVINTAPQASQRTLWEELDFYFSRRLAALLFIDAGIFCALLWRRHLKNPLFYGIAASMVILPYFHVGSSQDFCMRATIPTLFCIMAYCAEYLINELPVFKKQRFFEKCLLTGLVIALLIGSCTPAMEMFRSIYNVCCKRTILLAQDPFGSIGVLEEAQNFTAADYEETFFFRHLAQKEP